jgi:ribosomal protein L2
MAIRLYKACTPGTRHRVSPNFGSLDNVKPEKSLLKIKK